MTNEEKLASVLHDNEQDRAECDAWMDRHGDETKIAVKMKMDEDQSDPVMDIVMRFALLGFHEAYERELRRKIESGE